MTNTLENNKCASAALAAELIRRLTLRSSLPWIPWTLWFLWFPLTANAAGLSAVGAGFVSGMWVDVCTILPYCNMGAIGIETVVGIIAKTVLWIIGSGAVLVILYAAARMVTSGGNDEIARNAAKKTIFYALLGLLFAILAGTIVNYVFQVVKYIASYI